MTLTQALKGIRRYNLLINAIRAASRSHSAHFILHGDDNKFWVADAKETTILERAGYETILLASKLGTFTR
jgi:predicted extracellular nuclease